MTTPPRQINVECSDCGHTYKDWYRPSINLALDDFDDDYLEQASTTTCPECGVKHEIASLVVRDIDNTWGFEI